jgi:trehalose-phosphatase
MTAGPTISVLPAGTRQALDERLGESTPALFLDYDGVLTPIVRDPDQALLSDAMRAVVRRLGELCPTAVVSGRDHDDVRGKVALDNLVYAGSHGFDISGPEGLRHQHPGGVAALPALDAAQRDLEAALEPVAGAWVERKRFAVAVHYREVAAEGQEDVEAAVTRAEERHGPFRMTGGKKIFELRPDIDWHKGKAVLWLLETLGLEDEDVLPVYLGDDLTDEDAFEALHGRGLGVVLEDDHDRPTAADLRLADTEDTRRFLQDLVGLLEGRDT